MTEKISIREYARRIGCSEANVRKAIKAGLIEKAIVRGEGRYPLLIPEIASREWAENHDPSQLQNAKLAKHLHEARKNAPPMLEEEDDEEDLPPANAGVKNPAQMSLAELRRKNAEVNLHLAAITLKQRRGELVDKKQVYNALFSAGQEVKNAVLSVPDRVIDAVIAAPSRNEAHQLMYAALVEALTSIAEVQQRDITIQTT